MIAVMTAIEHPRVRAAGIQPSGISSRSAGAGSPHPLAWDPDYPGTHMWEAPPGGPHRPFGQRARQPHLTSEHAHPGLPSRQARFGTLGCLLDSQGIHKPASATSGSETIAAAIEQASNDGPARDSRRCIGSRSCPGAEDRPKLAVASGQTRPRARRVPVSGSVLEGVVRRQHFPSPAVGYSRPPEGDAGILPRCRSARLAVCRLPACDSAGRGRCWQP
jgi:hypothetical protein